jgi:hypothetical protein
LKVGAIQAIRQLCQTPQLAQRPATAMGCMNTTSLPLARASEGFNQLK